MAKHIQRYKKELDYSYSIGLTQTLALLESRPEIVKTVIIGTKLNDSEIVSKLVKLCSENGVNIESDDNTIRMLSNSDNVYVLGVFKKYTKNIINKENSVVLYHPSDAGNLGTIIRTMVGFDVSNLAIIEPAVDIFSPQVVRSSMGALFKINFEIFKHLETCLNKLNCKPYIATDNAQIYLTKVIPDKPWALILGNEGEGLPKDLLKLGENIKIPQSNKIDSYNLGVSAGICLYQFCK